MAEYEEFLTASIDDYLLSLADSVYQAQKQLSQMSVMVQPGQPAVSYQLPRVDFELKISFELARSTGETSGTGTGALLRARPLGVQSAGRQKSSAGAASIIKGSFVAVPAQGGKPPGVLRTRLKRLSSRELEIRVKAESAAGENLAGEEIQFNVDRTLSQELNQAENLTIELKDDTALWEGMVRTNAEGWATNLLRVSSQERMGAQVAVIIDALGQTETLIFKVE